jgi:fatty acid-binding protein DegV
MCEFEVIIKELAKTNDAIIAVLISSGISGRWIPP